MMETLKRGIKLFFADIRKAKWAIVLLIAYFVLFWFLFRTNCPLAAFTGIPCPGCGLTRAGLHVLCLDFAGAWKLNPFIYPIILLAFWAFFCRYFLPGRSMRGLLWCVGLLLAAMVLFYLWRMYRYFPGEPPINYHRPNLLYGMWHLLQLLK